MPVVAADINEAIALTTERVALENRTNGQVFDQYVLFIDAIAPIFSVDNEGERTVRNWLVQGDLIRLNLIDQGAGGGTLGPTQLEEIVDLACRIMRATTVAVNFSGVSAAQRTAVLAAWNASFGLLP